MSTLPAGFAKLIVPFACLFFKQVFRSVSNSHFKSVIPLVARCQ